MDMTGWWILPAMAPAHRRHGLGGHRRRLLRSAVQVNEILTSLMLTYVAVQLLYYLVAARGSRSGWASIFRRPRCSAPARRCPTVAEATLVPSRHFIAWLVVAADRLAGDEQDRVRLSVRVVGLRRPPAAMAGFGREPRDWAALLAGGGLAGLAGIFEATGPFGQLTPQFPGYGFTAIIVAFLGRLSPPASSSAPGAGDDLCRRRDAQITVRLPQAATSASSRRCCCSSCSLPTCWCATGSPGRRHRPRREERA
jgi:hypothetical protein